MWAAYAMAGELRQMWPGKDEPGSTQVLYSAALRGLKQAPVALDSMSDDKRPQML